MAQQVKLSPEIAAFLMGAGSGPGLSTSDPAVFLTVQEKQQKMVEVSGSLSPMGQTWMKFLVSNFWSSSDRTAVARWGMEQ